jgi:hypothetical protein
VAARTEQALTPAADRRISTQSNDQATRDPEAISQEIDETLARVADDVEAIAYHKTHLKEETKRRFTTRWRPPSRI